MIYSDVLYDGTVHCVKGINYSIQKFLGPLNGSKYYYVDNRRKLAYIRSAMINAL